MKALVSEAALPRGAASPEIVDLIAPDWERSEVVLSVLEPRPWTGGAEQVRQHEDKLNNYFAYVLDGFLVRQYPAYADLAVRIRVDCVAPPGEAERPFFQAAGRFAAAHGIAFEVRVVDDPFGPEAGGRAAWETVPG